MKTLLWTAAAALSAALLSHPAQALPQTFVSGTGNGATCSRTAPCASFQAAHDATDPGGGIRCLDDGEFGALTITKSVTIDCTGTVATASGSLTQVMTINTAGIVVRLRHIGVQGSDGANGIAFLNGAALFVEDCRLTAPQAIALNFVPSSGAKLFVADSVLSGNFTGIAVTPTGAGSARVMIDRVRFDTSVDGVRVGFGGLDPTANEGPSIVQVRDSTFAGNRRGVLSAAKTSVNSITIDRSSAVLNQAGVVSAGAPSFVIIGRSAALSNGLGLGGTNGGHTLSYQTNHLSGNAVDTDGAPTGLLTPK